MKKIKWTREESLVAISRIGQRFRANPTDPEAFAEEVLRKHALENKIPIPIIDVCLREGIHDVKSARFRDRTVSGMIRMEPGAEPVIYFSQDQVLVRQRFTVAHELGHFLLHVRVGDEHPNLIERGDVLALYRSEHDGSPEERDANRFAAALLMPRAALRNLADAVPVDLLAKFLAVSETTLLIRLERLNGRKH